MAATVVESQLPLVSPVQVMFADQGLLNLRHAIGIDCLLAASTARSVPAMRKLVGVALVWLVVVVRCAFAANAGGARRAAEIRSDNPARDGNILNRPTKEEDFKNCSKKFSERTVMRQGENESSAAEWITLDTRAGSEKFAAGAAPKRL